MAYSYWNKAPPSGVGMLTPARLAITRATSNSTYPAMVSVMVRTALRIFLVDHLDSLGPNKPRKLLQNTRVYKIAIRVLRTRIVPKRLKGCIVVTSMGSVAMMVVAAELMMETPMKDMAAITRFTRMEAPAANCTRRE